MHGSSLVIAALAQPSLSGILGTIGTYITAIGILLGAIPLLWKMIRDGKAAKLAAEAERKARAKEQKRVRRDARDAKLAAEAARIAALANQKTTDETKHIVNSQRTEMQQYIALLSDTLREAGKPVPRDKSLDK